MARETSLREAPMGATVVENIPREDVAVEAAAIEETTVMSVTAIATLPGGTMTVKAQEVVMTIADIGDTTGDLILVALRNRAPHTKNVTVETRILREGLTTDLTTRSRASLMKNRDLDLEAIDEKIYSKLLIIIISR